MRLIAEALCDCVLIIDAICIIMEAVDHDKNMTVLLCEISNELFTPSVGILSDIFCIYIYIV